MATTYDTAHRNWSQGSAYGGVCLSDKFEVLKDIGDGSFGSVALARVRGAGAHVARRGTMVAIKTMKKTFDSFAPCLELREIIFLRTLPNHPHIVPALDIFLDPLSKKLHIAMEYMDGNLYQLMKARDHKPFDGSTVKSILLQILSGLNHIHQNDFFHRDIKPENILVSVSAREDFGSAFKRYSQLITPPSTPPTYTIKIADFGLAREIHSKTPYTTYVSTRWYRAPEVLLRAGEYSAPVDIWAIGAMAVEIATLKPLFPGGNEVDQVWRVCEIMGSPGHWVNKHGVKVGGGQWKAGNKLAHKLGFTFPKMAPHTMDTILQPPQWPAEFCDFITWCLMWDPNSRPTATECLNHQYFTDGFDPLKAKASSKTLNRKQSDLNMSSTAQPPESAQTLSSKTSSWFRKSLIARESAPAVPQQQPVAPRSRPLTPRASPEDQNVSSGNKLPPKATKRATWTFSSLGHGAPMPILPSIRPVSPLSNTITAQAYADNDYNNSETTGKITRQLSFISQRNQQHHDSHRQDAERALNGEAGFVPPPSAPKEGFFSHLRKRARRISGRHQLPPTPRADDFEANVGCTPWADRTATFSDMQASTTMTYTPNPDFAELDRVIRNIDSSTQLSSAQLPPQPAQGGSENSPQRLSGVKRYHSVPHLADMLPQREFALPKIAPQLPDESRTTHRSAEHPPGRYENLQEQEQALDQALANAHAAVASLDRQHGYASQPATLPEYSDYRQPLQHSNSETLLHGPYPTPSTSEKRHTIGFGHTNHTYQPQPLDIWPNQRKSEGGYPFPTPPSQENEWAADAAAAIFGAGDQWK